MSDTAGNQTPTWKPPRKWEPVVMGVLLVLIITRVIASPAEGVVVTVTLLPVLVTWPLFYIQRRRRYRSQVGLK